MSKQKRETGRRPFSQDVPVGDSGLVYGYEGFEIGDRLEITAVTIQLPEEMNAGAAPTLRKVYALLEELHASGKTMAPEARHLVEDIARRAGLSEARPERQLLQRPVSGLTDPFLEQVAAAYQDHSLRTHKPNVAIASECGAKVTTVRSWVLEARKRGFLPPTNRGRAT